MITQQIDDSFNNYKYQLEPRIKISFMINCYSLPHNETRIKLLNLRHQVILGLLFLLKDNGQVTFRNFFFLTSPLKIGEKTISFKLEKQIKHSQKKDN